MAGCTRRAASAVLLVILGAAAEAQDVRTYTENGVEYRETRQKFLRPLEEVHYEDRERTVYREELATETREAVTLVPVTEYRWEEYWVNRWNPFCHPQMSYRLVPRTRMEARSIRAPLTTRRLVPEKRTERVPVMSRRMVEEEVIRRTAIRAGGTATADASSSNRADVAGRADPGARKLTDSSHGGWRPAGGTRGRY